MSPSEIGHSSDFHSVGRVILIQKISKSSIVHVATLFPLLHWLQNTFCFLCSSTPSHVGNHFKCSWGYSWGNFQKSISGHNFWLEWPTDVRSTPLSYIFNALFRDTPLDHVFCAQPNSQISKYPNIWHVCNAWCTEYFHNHRFEYMWNLKTMQQILKIDLECAHLPCCITLYITHFTCVYYNYTALFWDNLYRLEFYGWPSPNREGKNFIQLTTSPSPPVKNA